ncbi:MAG: hypothetical protein JST42_21185 [Bacteroidetes bacterium]|nr:hypothetical protein [Bacteroidota bacterium]
MKKLFFSAAALIALLSISSATFAQDGKWDRQHPRRAEVNSRLNNQDRRINQERREGEISGAKAARLHAQDHAIRHEERAMAARHDGHITRGEQARINRQENHVSRRIGR